MSHNYAVSRNTTKGFAQRVRKNLQFIMDNSAKEEDVHQVTQLVISLLGLIVFPWEDKALKSIGRLSLAELEKQGWPRWDIKLDKKGDTNTLGKLIWHLRNAVSHRRISFSSDHPDMTNVDIEFEDAPIGKPVNWRASINSGDLKKFCDLFTKRLEDAVS